MDRVRKAVWVSAGVLLTAFASLPPRHKNAFLAAAIVGLFAVASAATVLAGGF